MKTRSLAFARYWRNSLADAELGRGGYSRKDADKLQAIAHGSLPLGHIDQTVVDAFFKDERADLQTLEVILRPRVYLARVEHSQAKRNGAPQVVMPIVTPAILGRCGRLFPLAGSFVPRDLLEPVDRGSFAIGSVSAQDAFLTESEIPGVAYAAPTASADEPDGFKAQWRDYQAARDRLLAQVCPGWPSEDDGFIEAEYNYLIKKKAAKIFSQHILGLYDQLMQHAPDAKLFDRYASESIEPPEANLAAHAAFAGRLGHSSDRFPLAAAQRDSLSHLLTTRHGDILAVNGPPGTGKTTLLLSVVATLWAKAAVAGEDPPVIVAASTNNQAVTNIIDAFGKDFSDGSGPFAGRWLPGIKSFGAYLPSTSKESELSGKYQTRSFFESIETQQYLDSAQEQYVRLATEALPGLPSNSVQAIVDHLQLRIREKAGALNAIEAAWQRLAAAREEVRTELGENPAAELQARSTRTDSLASHKQACDQLLNRFEAHLARESIVYSLFSWLPPVAAKRLRLAKLLLKEYWPAHLAQTDWQDIHRIEPEIKRLSQGATTAWETQQRHLQRGQHLLEEEQRRLGEWKNALSPWGQFEDSIEPSLADVDQRADTHIRFPIFLLATHYWEGRWLLAMQGAVAQIDSQRTKRGRTVIEPRWRRRMMLTPCVVSTFHMLPKEMECRRRDGQDFVSDYLYDFADLLIVDEAGQVLPEVAGASFALAKTALVIGDTMQIEPIWSVPVRVDIGNLIHAGLLPAGDTDAAYEHLADLGKTASAGSVMRIAQCASRWHYEPQMPRGLFLYEHRRCFDEIIGYSNDLCYQGKLLPRRGAKAEPNPHAEAGRDGLPALGYLHIDGRCQLTGTGSRKNLLEAEVVAAWLAHHRTVLEAHYAKPLEDIVGVVTPFGSQVAAITQACEAVGIRAGAQPGEMTVGTVHALQGAERPVIIFSGVYSKHADGGFIDKRSSLLNVAVSRAKNTFLVFGDLDVFGLAAPSTPRGRLATQLFSKDSNALDFCHQPRSDLATVATGLSVLHDAAEHDAFLYEVLRDATREVHIVSPWIKLERIEGIGAMEGMTEAVRRGVKVSVYTDRDFNIDSTHPLQRRSQAKDLATTIDALRLRQIDASVVGKVHSKVVICDSNVYCIGSFNWFSAARTGFYTRQETSLVYRGPAMADEIDIMKSSLRQRAE